MDWKKLISDLEFAGLTQADIAKSCGCSQPYISQLKSGQRFSPAFQIGAALAALYQERHRPSPEMTA